MSSDPLLDDLAHAARLIGEAERIAWSITDENSKADALAEVARTLAATDPDGAERVARSLSADSTAFALIRIAEAANTRAFEGRGPAPGA